MQRSAFLRGTSDCRLSGRAEEAFDPRSVIAFATAAPERLAVAKWKRK